ncbi:MAG: hypothetical protein HY064_02625 [Bacteroidetes bacterium]|nr:hypothetical protein [Bacteroidota bacterium]
MRSPLLLSVFFISTFLFSSCARNLDHDITLNVNDSIMQFNIHAPADEKYYNPSDSADKRTEVITQLKNQFAGKGNDVKVVDANGEWTLEITSCNFEETVDAQFRVDSAFPHDTTWYYIHRIEVNMNAIIEDAYGYAVPVSAAAHDEEKLREEPIGKGRFFTPHTTTITFPDKIERRVLRRIYRDAMQEIKSRQKQ